MIYPQTVTLYQVDDDLYEPVEVATTNLFNTFLDALDGVSLSRLILDIFILTLRHSRTVRTLPTVKLAMIQRLILSTLIIDQGDIKV